MPRVYAATTFLTDELAVSGGWSKLEEECSVFESNSYAKSTGATRSMQMKLYFKFCEEFKERLSPTPCPPEQLRMYISYIARKLSYSSIKNYVSALNGFLKEEGEPPIDYKAHRLVKLMRGIRRTLGDAKHQSPPLLPSHLKKMLATTNNSPGHRAIYAAILCSFRALLRKCQVTVSESTLTRHNFSFYEWGMIIQVVKSKTIQFKERELLIPVAYTSNRDLCAVTWTARHFADFPADDASPAFLLPQGDSTTPLTYAIYNASIKLWCSKIGLDPLSISSHSLRRGGATFMRMSGASIQEIKERGDWHSDAVYDYLHAPLSERISVELRASHILSHTPI